MGYTKEFKKERYWHITEALTKIEELEDGGKLVFFDLPPEEQAEIRWLLYDYFHHKKLTNTFHVYTAGELLTIRKKKTAKVKFFVVQEEEPFEDIFRESLQLLTEEEAEQFFMQKVNPEEAKGLLERWRKVMV